jgi:hypothetical protein
MGFDSSNSNISELQQHLIRMLTPIMYVLLMEILGISQCFQQFQNRSQKIWQSEVKCFSFISDTAFWERRLWNMICSCPLLQPTLGSVLLAQTWVLSLCSFFSPLAGCSDWANGVCQGFIILRTNWELINSKPISSERYSSNLCIGNCWPKFRILVLQE